MLHSLESGSFTWLSLAATESGYFSKTSVASKPSRDTNPASPAREPTYVTDHNHWFRGRDILDDCLGAGSTTRCNGKARCSSQIRQWCFSPQTQARLVQKMPRRTHTLPELGSTGIYGNSIVYYPIGRFVNFVGIYIALAWRNVAFGHGTHAEREGKLKMEVHYDAISDTRS